MKDAEIERLSNVSPAELELFKQLDSATQKAVLDAMAEPLDNRRLAARDRAIAKARIKAYRSVMKSEKSGQ
jgi:LAS superfamily LD-carboxypeptidase LdcB